MLLAILNWTFKEGLKFNAEKTILSKRRNGYSKAALTFVDRVNFTTIDPFV